ncbi:MAG: hypothetical protein Q8M76_18565, partial [Spirochaetaceae bacterium]|nr:hypothetical protein [Spirochaetaceae bacterium]
MKKDAHVVALAIPFLFFLQLSGTLIESIYILDLLRSGLDEKALGVLFFFSPLLFLPLYKRRPREAAWLAFAILAAARTALPFLGTANRLAAAGLGTGAALALIPLIASARLKADARRKSDGAQFEARFGIAALALSVCLSATLRAVGSGIEHSLVPAGGWVGPV